jgi:predicted RNA binding protein YcfA (HicA-like mRNA interferase family)
VKYNVLIKILKQDGWFVLRQSGSHMIMAHPVKHRRIVCPNHGGKEVGKGLAIKILKSAGLL